MLRDINKWTPECQYCFVHIPKAAAGLPLEPIIAAKAYEIIGVDVLKLGITTTGNRYAV